MSPFTRPLPPSSQTVTNLATPPPLFCVTSFMDGPSCTHIAYLQLALHTIKPSLFLAAYTCISSIPSLPHCTVLPPYHIVQYFLYTTLCSTPHSSMPHCTVLHPYYIAQYSIPHVYSTSSFTLLYFLHITLYCTSAIPHCTPISHSSLLCRCTATSEDHL